MFPAVISLILTVLENLFYHWPVWRPSSTTRSCRELTPVAAECDNGVEKEERTMSIAYPPTVATLDDLMKVEGKAELIAGRIVKSMPSGALPGLVALNIAVELKFFQRQLGHGMAFGDNVGFTLPQPLKNGRLSFSPDAAFYSGAMPKNAMRFVLGVPDFALEVRSENDYTPSALREQALKRADYFDAGTLVVWDVDPIAQVIASYRSTDPNHATIFQVSDHADAEPALPGWRVPVAGLFA